ncbi:ABC transporter permease [Fictibacillus barbaricus]|uniref:ABC-2 type transport system permease protein n=1 Tax=Fictibacillus barbaricus TaxID=182136 RepID=A0ABU1TXB7_9BACL|nr:ABC-2 family transporter protein [Fictibacillus barbaricus]MDR7071867.1 ABC-2 type transport system permease protein [Fictibacillus barbaricus]
MNLFIKLVSGSIRSQMQYKINFLVSSLSYALIMAVDFILLAAILHRFDNVKGWNLYEVGLLYGISSVAITLYRVFGVEIHNFEKYMIEGEFDSLLIRPVSPLSLLLTKNLDLSRIGGTVQGVLILAISIIGLSLKDFDMFLLLVYLPISIFSGLIICFSLGLLTATIAFWTQRIKDFQVFTLYAPFNAANYPMNIYPGWLKLIFFTVIPVGFMNYTPILFLLNKGGTVWNLALPPAVALVFLFLTLRFWQFGIRHYHSTGS